MTTLPGRPKKGPRFGGDAEHQPDTAEAEAES